MVQIVLIPGLISDGFVWSSTQKRLGLTNTHVADLTHHDSITDMAKGVLSQADGQLILIGHSMGARVAMEASSLAPERIKGLGLLNTGIHSLREGETEKRQSMINLAHASGMQTLADHWLPGMLAEGISPNENTLAELKKMVLRMTPEIHERQMLALLNRPDATKTMQHYKGPLLLLTGRQDLWSPVAQHEAILKLCPQAKLVIVDDAGHFAPVEQPEKVAETIYQFTTSLA